MCGFVREGSPNDGAVGIISHIVVEHEIHAQNDKGPGNNITNNITEALGRGYW